MEPDLRRTASGVLLLATDYDGTLAPIVGDPAAAFPDPNATTALGELAALPDTHVAIMSGRARAELERLVGPLPGVRLIGGHGAEWDDLDATPEAGELASRLQNVADRFPGAVVEAKPTGAAFHYRQVDDDDGALAAEAAIDAAGELAARVVHGKRVVELSTSNTDKGAALARLRKELAPDVTVFIGDDVTDEDAFLTLGPEDVAIKVGPGETAAAWRVADQSSVAGLLDEIVGLREANRR